MQTHTKLFKNRMSWGNILIEWVACVLNAKSEHEDLGMHAG